MTLKHLLSAAFAAAIAFAPPALADPDMKKIGFVYVGPAADYGYNTSMDLGRQYLEENLEGIEIEFVH